MALLGGHRDLLELGALIGAERDLPERVAEELHHAVRLRRDGGLADGARLRLRLLDGATATNDDGGASRERGERDGERNREQRGANVLHRDLHAV